MTQLEPENFYRKPNARLQAALDRHVTHTQVMLVAAMVASLTIVLAAAAVMTALF